jgi:hypothetical protein
MALSRRVFLQRLTTKLRGGRVPRLGSKALGLLQSDSRKIVPNGTPEALIPSAGSR